VWGLPWGPRSAWMIGELGEFKFRYAAKSPIFPFKIRVSRLLLDKGPVPLSARSALDYDYEYAADEYLPSNESQDIFSLGKLILTCYRGCDLFRGLSGWEFEECPKAYTLLSRMLNPENAPTATEVRRTATMLLEKYTK